MRVRDKVIVVTGGANGLGRELVLLLLARGARVAAVDIDGNALAEVADLAGNHRPRLSTHRMDITDREAVEALPDQVLAAHGAVDGLINNAGIIQPFVRVWELEDAAVERVMRVNFYGTLYMTRAFLPLLLQRPEAHIVNVSSMGALVPVPGQTIYGASKAAVKLFTEGLRSELRDTRVRVTIVFPGGMATNIAAHSGVTRLPQPPGGRSYKVLSPAKAAQIIVDAMERNKERVVVGSDARTMDLLSRLHPRWAADLIYRQMKDLLSV